MSGAVPLRWAAVSASPTVGRLTLARVEGMLRARSAAITSAACCGVIPDCCRALLTLPAARSVISSSVGATRSRSQRVAAPPPRITAGAARPTPVPIIAPVAAPEPRSPGCAEPAPEIAPVVAPVATVRVTGLAAKARRRLRAPAVRAAVTGAAA